MSFKSSATGLLLCTVFVLAAGARPSDESLLLKAFAGADSVHQWPAPLVDAAPSGDNPAHSASRIIGYSVFVHKRLIGYGLASAVQSKSSLLAVLLAVDTTGRIVTLELPHTPDGYSARLQSARWKVQFRGRQAGDLNDINAVSGATYSSADVRRTVQLMLDAFGRSRVR